MQFCRIKIDVLGHFIGCQKLWDANCFGICAKGRFLLMRTSEGNLGYSTRMKEAEIFLFIYILSLFAIYRCPISCSLFIQPSPEFFLNFNNNDSSCTFFILKEVSVSFIKCKTPKSHELKVSNFVFFIYMDINCNWPRYFVRCLISRAKIVLVGISKLQYVLIMQASFMCIVWILVWVTVHRITESCSR